MAGPLYFPAPNATLGTAALMTVDPISDVSRYPVLGRSRLVVAVILIVTLTVVLIERLYFLQIVEHVRYRALSIENRFDLLPVPPVRGMIYDRYGEVLAENHAVYELEVVPEQVRDMASFMTWAAQSLSLTERDRKKFDKRLHGRASFERILLKSGLSEEQAARFAVNQYRFPGVALRGRLRRSYPLGHVTAHVVGYVGRISDKDLDAKELSRYRGVAHIGKLGIESYYEGNLLGRIGYEQVETNAHGRVVRTLAREPAISGHHLHLTLDSRLQKVVRNELAGHRGAAVVLEPHTGEILAFVSVPDYDPNLFAKGIDQVRYTALLQDSNKPLLNRALYGRYAPGSTLKPILALAGLEHTIDPRRRVKCPGFFALKEGGRVYRCWRKQGHGAVNLKEALEQSCDTYFYQLGLTLGISGISEALTTFGFGKQTGIDLASEPDGLIPTALWKQRRYGTPWYPGDTLNASIGQGYILSTPLQLAAATAALANRGRLVRPHLLRGVEDPETGEIQRPAEQVTEVQLGDASQYERVIEGMIAVMHGSYGTARRAGQRLSYRIAAKTGTSQLVSLPQAGEAAKDTPERLKDHALFIAFAPAERPRIALALVIENGGSGGKIAAPIARRIFDYYFVERLRRAALKESRYVRG
ncbi:MAG TPA: penicillin-binding protein 2 [Gammaproteobacteria bacterium]|nr:penicillin-binding protein 2 [Gammaproteobacteria bacterium]